jgi:integrase
MGSVKAYESAAGVRWRIQYRDEDHKGRTRTGFLTKKDAESALRKAETAVEEGRHVAPASARAKLGPYGRKWLEGYRNRAKISSYTVMETTWRVHVEPKWGERTFSSIRSTEVRDWLGALPLGAQAKRRAHGVLAGILDDAVADHVLFANPARDKRIVTAALPKIRSTKNVYLTHEQVAALAAVSSRPALVLFLAYTGLRWGEMAALRVGDIDQLRRRLTVRENAVRINGRAVVGTTKNGSEREVPYPAFLTLELAPLCVNKTRDDLIFGEAGKHLASPSSSTGWFVNAVRRAQETDPTFPTITPHDLRHTAASLAVSAGANVKALQRMLGHAKASMTLDVYADLFEDDLDAVAVSLDQARSGAIVVKTVVK